MIQMLKEFKRIYALLAGDMPLGDGLLDSDYEHYWAQREQADRLIKKRKSRIQRRMLSICKEIEDNSSVLDVGCGNGELLSVIHHNRRNCKLFGIDISQDAVNRASAKALQVYKLDITKDKLDDLGPFDYVILSEIIEHLPNPEKVLLDLKKITKKKIIVTTPNIAFILFRLRMFFWGKFPVTTVFHIREHLSFWSVKDFVYWAKYLGFKVEKKCGFGGIGIFNLNRIMPNLFANHMLYVLVVTRNQTEF